MTVSAALNTIDDELDLDLDKARSARRETKRVPGLRIGGRRLELPVELPVDVLAPLTEVNIDVTYLVRQVLDIRKQAEADGESANEELVDAVVNMLLANPDLPVELVNAVKTMARRLFGDEGYEHLSAQRLTIGDLGEIAKFAGRTYGVGLGEASRPSDSSEGTGTTSKPTSSGSTDSTSGRSGKSRARKAS